MITADQLKRGDKFVVIDRSTGRPVIDLGYGVIEYTATGDGRALWGGNGTAEVPGNTLVVVAGQPDYPVNARLFR